MNQEVWRDISDLENYYQVSNYGNVRSKDRNVWNGKVYYTKKARIIKKCMSSTGYHIVRLVDGEGKPKTCKVHRLVAYAFIPNHDNKPNINHIDGNPLNNHVNNLEWCTQIENIQHAIDTGLRKTISNTFGKDLINDYNSGIPIYELINKYNVSKVAIHKFFNKERVKRLTKYNIDINSFRNDIANGLNNTQLAGKYDIRKDYVGRLKYKIKNGEI